ncbi:MAG TPA: cupin domain-containing protein [Methylomirabilota bacterium]|nr:cupin domain-containing protein [Methylomirabilota bacterium]
MTTKTLVAVAVAVIVVAGWQAGAGAQDKPGEEKGVKATNLVTSLGPFRQVTSIPVILTGQTIEIEPGGHTARERHLVPSFVYVLDGTLVTNTEGGPIGVGGIQYHAAGQSYSDPVGVWHTYSNPGTAPVKYLLLLVGTGGPTTEKAKADE